MRFGGVVARLFGEVAAEESVRACFLQLLSEDGQCQSADIAPVPRPDAAFRQLFQDIIHCADAVGRRRV